MSSRNLSAILLNQKVPSLAGLYIHVPFCVQKCAYCDFYSTTDYEQIGAYVSDIRKEIGLAQNLVKDSSLCFDTIYLGGGTPSLLSDCQLFDILDCARASFSFSPDVEITMEANPGALNPAAVKAWLANGVNRFTLGIQSFSDERLAFLGRIHNARQARDGFELLRNSGCENLGLDLIYGLPGQEVDEWRRDLESAIALGPDHISCYMLTYEPSTMLHKRLMAREFVCLEEGPSCALFALTSDILEQAGYQQYEISNYSKGIERRSRHNQKYWHHIPYIGLGPSAHSFIKPRRWWNKAALHSYHQALSAGQASEAGSEMLSREQLLLETIYLGLRTIEGIDLRGFRENYGFDFIEHYKDVLDHMLVGGFVCINSDQCALTKKGLIVSDAIAAAFSGYSG